MSEETATPTEIFSVVVFDNEGMPYVSEGFENHLLTPLVVGMLQRIIHDCIWDQSEEE